MPQQRFQARQGDVWIESIETIPSGATERQNDGRVVLAYGEVTGHAHAITVDRADPHVREYTTADSAERFLQVTRSAALVHEEHGTITLPPGAYRSYVQREYSPDAIRAVAD